MVIPRCSHRLFTWNEWTLCSTSIWSVDMEVMEGVPWARNSMLAGKKETKIEHKGAQKKMWKRRETETCPAVGILDFVCGRGNLHSEKRGEKLHFCGRRYNISSSALGGLCYVPSGREQEQHGPATYSLWLLIKSFPSKLFSQQQPSWSMWTEQNTCFAIGGIKNILMSVKLWSR